MVFCKFACVVSLHVLPALDIESPYVSLGKGKRLAGEERVVGRAFTLWDFVPGHVRFSLRHCLIRVKGTFKGGAIPSIFQILLKWMQKQKEKASGLGANFLLDEANRCLQSSDFLCVCHRHPSEGSINSMPVYSVIVCKPWIHSVRHANAACKYSELPGRQLTRPCKP